MTISEKEQISHNTQLSHLFLSYCLAQVKKKTHLHSKIRNRSFMQSLNLGPVFSLFISLQRIFLVLDLLLIISYLLTAVCKGQSLDSLELTGILQLNSMEWRFHCEESRFNKFILIEMFFIGHKIPFVSMGLFYNASIIHNESKPKI